MLVTSQHPTCCFEGKCTNLFGVVQPLTVVFLGVLLDFVNFKPLDYRAKITNIYFNTPSDPQDLGSLGLTMLTRECPFETRTSQNLWALAPQSHDIAEERRLMNAIYHITTRTAWAQALSAGSYCPPSLAAEGFVHCCRDDQLLRVANALYRSRSDLIVLVISPNQLGSVTLKDDCTESGEMFPHIYGAISCHAVKATVELHIQSDGTFGWPQPPAHATDAHLAAVATGSESQFSQAPGL
jgi:uncharacterized protein (DUF952 family)